MKESNSPTLPGELGPLVARAFGGECGKWRTVGGIARAAALDEKVVRDYATKRAEAETLLERVRKAAFAG